jgi:two-component system, OmpR family, response regulator ResD
VLENAVAVGTLAVMAAAPAPHVLVVDDEPIVRDVLTRYLTRAGYQVSDAADGEQALEAISAGHPDVVLLDLMLPRVNGLDVLRSVRRDSDVPVIVLSARSSERERIDGLRQGADDYVIKPYSPGEVVARVEAVLRRAGATGAALTCGAATIDPAAREVRRDGQVVHTTRKEFELLHLLVRHPGQVFSRRQLLERVWEDSWAGATDTVTVHIRRLRAKVELEPSAPRHLVTVHGVGYRFDP